MPQSTMKGNISGQAIKSARTALNISQGELIEILSNEHQINYNQTMLSRIEQGSRTVRDFELSAFAKALQRSPNQLLDWEE